MRTIKIFLATLFSIGLAACGGGSGGGSSTPAASTLGGVAAVGTPIVNGNISVVCAAGSALATTTNPTTGAWLITLSGQTLPCAVELSGGTINGAINIALYYSMATTTGTVNVTPLTDLMVANLAGSSTLSTWFAGLRTTPTPLNVITQSQVDAALAKLRTALGGLTALSTINPINTVFTPTSGDVIDDMLTALQTALNNTSVTYVSLLSKASLPDFTAPSGFGVALMTAYAGTTSGSATSPTTGSGPGITGALPTSAAPSGEVTINGMNFVQSASNYRVSFNGTTVTPFLRTLFQLAVYVPTGATSGTLTVTDLTTNQVYTVPGGFTVTGGATALTFNAIPANGIFTAPANNVSVDFVDIVGATVAINSTDIIVDITLRNLPTSFAFNQTNVSPWQLQYEWGVDFDINNDNVADYSLSVSSYKFDNTPAVGPLFNSGNPIISTQVNVWKDDIYLVAASASITGNTIRLSVPKSANPDLANITSSSRVRIKSFYRSDSSTTFSDSI